MMKEQKINNSNKKKLNLCRILQIQQRIQSETLIKKMLTSLQYAKWFYVTCSFQPLDIGFVSLSLGFFIFAIYALL
jgi:hypothetical protein